MRKMALELKGWWAFAAIAALLIPSAMGFPGLNLTKNCSTISANVDEIIVYSFYLKNKNTKFNWRFITADSQAELSYTKAS